MVFRGTASNGRVSIPTLSIKVFRGTGTQAQADPQPASILARTRPTPSPQHGHRPPPPPRRHNPPPRTSCSQAPPVPHRHRDSHPHDPISIQAGTTNPRIPIITDPPDPTNGRAARTRPPGSRFTGWSTTGRSLARPVRRTLPTGVRRENRFAPARRNIWCDRDHRHRV